MHTNMYSSTSTPNAAILFNNTTTNRYCTEKSMLPPLNNIPNPANSVKLNVGGTLYESTLETLTQKYADSRLARSVMNTFANPSQPPQLGANNSGESKYQATAMKSSGVASKAGNDNQQNAVTLQKDSQGFLFIDRDGPSFRYILQYLRDANDDKSYSGVNTEKPRPAGGSKAGTQLKSQRATSPKPAVIVPATTCDIIRHILSLPDCAIIAREARYYEITDLAEQLENAINPRRRSATESGGKASNSTTTCQSPQNLLTGYPQSGGILFPPTSPMVLRRNTSRNSSTTDGDDGLWETGFTVTIDPALCGGDLGSGGYITIGYHGTFSFGRQGMATDVNFRKIAKILIAGRVQLCREVFGDSLNEGRDPDRGHDDETLRYTARFFLKHTVLEQAFDALAASRFLLVSSCASGTSAASSEAMVKPGSNTEEDRWAHYTEYVFYRPPMFAGGGGGKGAGGDTTSNQENDQ